MTYNNLLTCQKFTQDFIEWNYCDITGINDYDEEDFHCSITKEFTLELTKFFKTLDVNIVEIHNHPISYEVSHGDDKYEFWCTKTMFTEIIEIIYGITTD
jgi:hypothetical protein